MKMTMMATRHLSWLFQTVMDVDLRSITCPDFKELDKVLAVDKCVDEALSTMLALASIRSSGSEDVPVSLFWSQRLIKALSSTNTWEQSLTDRIMASPFDFSD
ncbi:hypothetical protein N7494_003292 [Penicillium frequentans]|uniref:Uncharacterized protein n=1 Tax=Penicillium frequentans TaxID=3151616 RepID=A0AAD6CYD9_9EURO|nr:hypothetical protein N7494_003292 [Penicillium glabrum]